MQALQEAIDRSGGIAPLARAVGRGLKPSAISNWLTRGRVPAQWGPSIERATGVRCEDLCPDAEWWVLRGRRTRRAVARPGA